MRTLFVRSLLLSLLAGTVGAQEKETDRSFMRPTSESGSEFSQKARSRWQRTSAEYLKPDADPNLAKPNTPTDWRKFEPSRSETRITAGIILAILIGALLLFWWNNRLGGSLFSRQKAEGRIADPDDEGAVLLQAQSEGDISLSALAKITNPRDGIRALMVQALVRAAQQNDIALRRSLTTRDVLRRVPNTWQHRPALQDLVSRAELILFGGREISDEDYADALTRYRPLISGGRSR